MKAKQQVQNLIPLLQELTSRYGYSEELASAIEKHQQFALRLPLIGEFSAGKSSLINKLLDDKDLLAKEVTPETSLPVEIQYAPTESIELMHHTQAVATLTRQQLKEQNYPVSGSPHEYWVKVQLANPLLAQLKDIVLVDMPGWGSGIAEHNQAIDSYVERSGAYALVVSADEGTIRESTQQALIELKLLNKPVALFITKTDKKASDLPEVKNKLTQEVTRLLGKAPLHVVTTNRKEEQTQVIEAINNVIEQASSIYYHMVQVHFLTVIERIKSKVTILLNEDNLTLEQAQQACDKIPQELAELKNQLHEVEQQIQNTVPTCINQAQTNLKTQLHMQQTQLAQAVINQTSIQTQVSNAMRQSFLQCVEQDFKPKVTRQLKTLQNVGDLAPSDIQISHNFTPEKSPVDTAIFTQVINTVITKIINLVPALKPFTAILQPLAKLFSSEAEEQFAKSQALEQAKGYVSSSLIPSITSQAQSAFSNAFNNMLAKIQDELNQQADSKAADKQQALTQLQAQLTQITEQDQLQKQQYQSVLDQLNNAAEQLTQEQV